MFQRLQSVFIFMFVVSSFFGYTYLPEKQFFILNFSSFKVDFYSFFMIFGVIFGFATLFMFKNRTRQLFFLKTLFACQLLLLIFSIYNLIHFKLPLYNNYSLLSIIFGIVFLLLSLKYLKKDIDLINSIDRIR